MLPPPKTPGDVAAQHGPARSVSLNGKAEAEGDKQAARPKWCAAMAGARAASALDTHLKTTFQAACAQRAALYR